MQLLLNSGVSETQVDSGNLTLGMITNTVTSLLAEKADSSELTAQQTQIAALSATMDSKAETSDLDALTVLVDEKADLNLMEEQLGLKANVSDVTAEMSEKADSAEL